MSTLPGIGLLGRKRSGKNTVADHLTLQYGYQQIGFADPLRAMALSINPIVDVSPYHGLRRYGELVTEYGYDNAKECFPEVRRLLQVIGTEAVREVLGENVWVDALVRRLELASPEIPYAVTDVRFPNEAQALHDRGFVLARIVRPDLPNDGDLHPSETALDEWDADVTLYNDGTLAELYAAVDRVMEALTEKPAFFA